MTLRALRHRRLTAAIFAALVVVLCGAAGAVTASAAKIQFKVYNNTSADIIPSIDSSSPFPESAPRAIAAGDDFTYTAEVLEATPLIVRFSDLNNPRDTLSVTVRNASSPPEVNYGEQSMLCAYVPFPVPIPSVHIYKSDGSFKPVTDYPPPPPGDGIPSE